MRLSHLFIYPVKSLRGYAVKTAQIDELGLVGDRRFLIVDTAGQQFTQRAYPRMAHIDAILESTELVLKAVDVPDCRIPLPSCSNPTTLRVTVWKSIDLVADDCGEEPSAWLTAYLGATCRLVRIGDKFRRPLLDEKRARSNDVVSFADGYPFLLTSDASLSDLNDRLLTKGEDAIPMNRFRPNIVVSGCSAYAEDSWSQLRIGAARFRSGGPCSRCVVTTTDQLTAQRGTEPLRTLASYRRDPHEPSEVLFGLNLIHETKSGRLSVGDKVEAVL